MRTIIVFFVIFIPIQFFSQQSKVSVDFNKNIEFLGYIIEQGDPAGNDKNHPISIIIDKFPENKTSKTLYKLFDLAGDIDYSTLVHLMYFLPEFPLKDDYTVSEEFACFLGFDSENERNRLDIIVSELNNYYTESSFSEIWKGLKPYVKNVQSSLEENKPNYEVFNRMELFYQYKFNHYSIQPILTLWQAGFGIRDLENNKAVFILGPLNPNYDFNNEQAFINLTIHEFGHSFVNHVLLENKRQLSRTKHFFEPIQDAMTSQGYSDWETCIIEHFVRAGEVIIRELVDSKNQHELLLIDYSENRKFIYLEFIVEKLKFYRLIKNYSYKESTIATLNDLAQMKD